MSSDPTSPTPTGLHRWFPSGWRDHELLDSGGGSKLERFPRLSLLGVDQDPEILSIARGRLEPFQSRVRTEHARMSELGGLLAEVDEPVVGVLMDLGASSLQLDRPERGFGKTIRRQRQRLARQPFEIAVLAHVQNRVGANLRPKPRVKGEIAVRRDEVGIVIALLRIDVVAARRLQPDHDVAATERRDRQRAAIGFTA